MPVSFKQSVLLFVSVLGLTSAVPTPAELAPRACAILPPANISRLNKTRPNEYINGQDFSLRREGGPGSNTVRSVVSFGVIPQGATGCMLQIDIPKLPTQNNPGPIASGTATQADVWLITNPPRDNPYDNNYIREYSWNKPPVRNQFVSTTIFPAGSPTNEPYKTYLWSGTCQRTLSFEFELSDWQQGSGDVNFFNTLGGKLTLTPIGFSLFYNC